MTHKRAKDPADTKGGRGGTHGHGDDPREPKHRGNVAPESPGYFEPDEEAEEAERIARGLAAREAPGPGPKPDGHGKIAERQARELEARRKRGGAR